MTDFKQYVDEAIKSASDPGAAKNIRKIILTKNASSGSSPSSPAGDTAGNQPQQSLGLPSLANTDNYPLNGYVWYPFYTSLKNNDLYTDIDVLNVPKLQVWEFQPSTDISMYLRLLLKAIEIFEKTSDTPLGETFSEIKDKLGSVLERGISLINPTDEKAILKNFEDGNKAISNAAEGKYLTRFEFPTYNEEIWKTTAGDGWTGAGFLERYLGFLSNTFKGTGLDYPAKPKYEANTGSGETVTSKFYLFNAHISAAIKNLQLLYRLLPGAYWIQDSYYQRPPNLYTVKYENYYQFQLCALNATVKWVGKSRRPPAQIVQRFESVTMLPDIFEVTLEFKSILPNTFNQFIAPYFGGSFPSPGLSGVDQVRTTFSGINDSGIGGLVNPPEPAGQQTAAGNEPLLV